MTAVYLTSNDGATLGQPAIPRDTFTQAMAALADAFDSAKPVEGRVAAIVTPWGTYTTDDDWPTHVQEYISGMFDRQVISVDYYRGYTPPKDLGYSL